MFTRQELKFTLTFRNILCNYSLECYVSEMQFYSKDDKNRNDIALLKAYVHQESCFILVYCGQAQLRSARNGRQQSAPV